MPLSWRQKCVERLASDPTNWLRLSEVFAEVERDIPVHYAMRRQRRPTNDVGLNTARWRMFLSHVSPLVERRACSGDTFWRALRTDLVRLLPEKEPCEACGGARYLTSWGNKRGRGSGRAYACLNCSKPQSIEPIIIEWIDPAILIEPTVAKPLPKPLLRLIPPTQAIAPKSPPKPQPSLRRITATVPERPTKHFIELAFLSTYDEIWKECVFRCMAPKFQNEPKMVRKLHRALEAGLVDEFFRLNTAGDRFTEVNTVIADVQWKSISPEKYIFDLSKINLSVFDNRGVEWAAHALTIQQRKRGEDHFIGAYAFGCATIFAMATAQRLPVIVNVIEKLVPKPKPRQPARTSWLAPMRAKARNVLSRYRNR